MNLPEIKPCPWCGGQPDIIPQRTIPTMNGSGQPYAYDLRHFCPVIEGTPKASGETSDSRVWRRIIQLTGKTEEGLIAAWNTRTPAPMPDGWLPIESAPKDGSRFLVWRSKLQGHFVAKADPTTGVIIPTCPDYTHWRPLPPPPADTTNNQESAQ